jgi:hypothetical protein
MIDLEELRKAAVRASIDGYAISIPIRGPTLLALLNRLESAETVLREVMEAVKKSDESSTELHCYYLSEDHFERWSDK